MRLLKYLCFLSFLVLTVHSCKDACDDVDCTVNGTCVDGTCVCNTGWSGVNCGTNVCDNSNCGDNGTCDTTTGECTCDAGYEGENCDIESRAKHIGIYQGDMTPCIPAIIAPLIPADDLAALTATELEVSASSEGINFLYVSAKGDVLDLGLDTDITEDNFVIPEFSQVVDLSIAEVTVTGNGTGMYLDANSMQLDLMITFEAALGSGNSDCTVVFTKQ